jgi:hypothetical protein
MSQLSLVSARSISGAAVRESTAPIFLLVRRALTLRTLRERLTLHCLCCPCECMRPTCALPLPL